MQEIWNQGWPLFVLGLWLGAPIGMFVMGLCVAARRADRPVVDYEVERAKFSKAFYDELEKVGSVKFRVVQGDCDEKI